MSASSRKAPKPPYWTAGPCICRLCGEPIVGRGPKVRWHIRCLEEYRPIASPGEVRQIAHAASGGRCALCGASHDLEAPTWEADHREPLWRADGDIRFWLRGNLQVLCLHPCHADKTAKDAAEWRARRAEKSARGVQPVAPPAG